MSAPGEAFLLVREIGRAKQEQLVGLYLCGRVSMDLIGAMLILYFTHCLGRSEDFESWNDRIRKGIHRAAEIVAAS